MKAALPKIALGAWAWGNDGTFGTNFTEKDLRPIFDSAMKSGLNLWDTAYVYGMGTSEEVLGKFVQLFGSFPNAKAEKYLSAIQKIIQIICCTQKP